MRKRLQCTWNSPAVSVLSGLVLILWLTTVVWSQGQNFGGGGVVKETFGMQLRRLAAAAQINNPLINVPLGPAPTWVANTVYSVGQVVTNGANQYICNVSGAAASSGGPTGTGNAAITDNLASWYFYGLAQPAAAAVNQPAISTSASVPGGLTQTIAMNASPSPFYYTNGLPFVDGFGSYSFYSAYTIGTTKNQENFAVTFITDATKIGIKVFGSSPYKTARIIVDGQYVTVSGYIPGTGGNPSYVVVDFTSAGARKSRVITYSSTSQQNTFGGIAIGPTEEAWAPSTKDRLRVVWIADSIASGGGSPGSSPSVEDADTPRQVGQLLGWSDVFDTGQGGIGYINTNTGAGYTYVQQFTNFVVGNSLNPNILIIAGGQNDPNAAGYSTSVETAAVLTMLQTARAAYSTIPIIVLGVFPGATGPSATYIALETAIKAGVTQFGDANTYFIPITNDPVQAWMTGTGKVSSTTGTGNSDAYTSADNVHATDMGRIYQAQRMAQAILNVIQNIT